MRNIATMDGVQGFGKNLLMDVKRILTYSPWKLLRERNDLQRAIRVWQGDLLCLFPYTNMGGAEQVHADILAAVSDHRPLIVICGFSKDDVSRSIFARHGQLLEVPRLLNHPLTRLKAERQLAVALNARANAAVFSSNTSTFFELLPHLKGEVRAVYLQHAFLFQPEGNRQHRAWLKHFPRIDRYVFVSAHARLQYQQLLLANNIPRSSFDKLHFIGNAVHRFGSVQQHDRLGLLFIGRHSPEKRLDVFLALCDRLEASHPGRFRFTVVGADRFGDHPNVDFAGSVQDPDRIAKITAAHDLLVLTSDREGFPMVIMEAMAQGLVVLSTPVGDVPIRLRPEGAIVTTAVDRDKVLNEMSIATVELDGDHERLRHMKEAALHQAKAEFGMDRFVGAYRALLSPHRS